MKIDIIGGKEEAALISSTDLNELISKDKTYLYLDVGGGSTELRNLLKKSFNRVTHFNHKYQRKHLQNDLPPIKIVMSFLADLKWSKGYKMWLNFKIGTMNLPQQELYSTNLSLIFLKLLGCFMRLSNLARGTLWFKSKDHMGVLNWR